MTFFKRKVARVKYSEACKFLQDASAGSDNSTLLKTYCETRWGSVVDMLQSLARNMKAVRQAIITLQADGFAFERGQLWWTLNESWWNTINNLVTWLAELRYVFFFFWCGSKFFLLCAGLALL